MLPCSNRNHDASPRQDKQLNMRRCSSVSVLSFHRKEESESQTDWEPKRATSHPRASKNRITALVDQCRWDRGNCCSIIPGLRPVTKDRVAEPHVFQFLEMFANRVLGSQPGIVHAPQSRVFKVFIRGIYALSPPGCQAPHERFFSCRAATTERRPSADFPPPTTLTLQMTLSYSANFA